MRVVFTVLSEHGEAGTYMSGRALRLCASAPLRENDVQLVLYLQFFMPFVVPGSDLPVPLCLCVRCCSPS